MNRLAKCVCGSLLAVVAIGCGTSYQWRSSVPEKWRTVSVPTFRNESNLTEIGVISTRQVAREFQREGTFMIRPAGEAALEVQGVIKSVGANNVGYNRRTGMRVNSYKMNACAQVSVIDKLSGRVLIDNRRYEATATFAVGKDLTTAERDASGRLAEDLARQIVDDVLQLSLDKEEIEK